VRPALARGGAMLAAALVATPVAFARPAFDPGRSSFVVQVGKETVPYRVLAFSAPSGDRVAIEIPLAAEGVEFDVASDSSTPQRRGKSSWTWKAPTDAGLYPLHISRKDSGETVTINVFVTVAIARVHNGRLNGYRIDPYPATPLNGLAIYRTPRGFIEVTEALLDTPVSPHFRLGQFLCKQESGYPKYLVLRERLLLKLELLLQIVNAAGYRCDGFEIMSGYRTPFYNREIGNVKYSRHVWGGAADVFIDEDPRDGEMDDLNRDGRTDWRDAAVLYDLFDGLYGKESYAPFVGGLGRYKRTRAHGPFVHVDVRGFRARWGT